MNEMSPARHLTSLPQETVDRFAAIVGKGHALVDPDQQLPYLQASCATSTSAARRWCSGQARPTR